MGSAHISCLVTPETRSRLSVVMAKRDIWDPRVLRTPSNVQLRPVNHAVLAWVRFSKQRIRARYLGHMTSY